MWIGPIWGINSLPPLSYLAFEDKLKVVSVVAEKAHEAETSLG